MDNTLAHDLDCITENRGCRGEECKETHLPVVVGAGLVVQILRRVDAGNSGHHRVPQGLGIGRRQLLLRQLQLR